MRKRAIHSLPSDASHIEQVREALHRSLEILKLAIPDTFLGNRTHEPFPEEKQAD